MKFGWLILSTVFPTVTFQATAIYGGNRTTYPSGLLRNESSEADPTYENKAEGRVNILSLPYHVPTTSLKQVQDIWGTRNNINITYPLFRDTLKGSLPVESSDTGTSTEENTKNKFQSSVGAQEYYDAVLSECQSLMSQIASGNTSAKTMGMTDLVWMDATMISYLEPCLVDIWAWDFSIGSGMDYYTLLNGVVRDRLVAVAVEVQTSFLMYNRDLLSGHNYDSPPSSMTDMDVMLKSILQNERAMDNFKLSGLTAPFLGKEDLISLLAEWAAAGNTSIISPQGNVGLLDGNITDVLNMIASWVDLGVIDVNDLDTHDTKGAFDRFKDQKSLFLRATPDLLDKARKEITSFDWNTAVFPAYSEDMLSYLGPGTLSGWYVGVYKYAPNPFGAVKVAKYLSSLDYQRRLFVIPDMTTISSIVPIYPSILNARSYCQSIGHDICNTYVDTQTALRPGSQSGRLYSNVSYIVDSYLKQIFRGDISVFAGLQTMDQRIRTILGKPNRTTTGGGGTEVIVTKPIKKSFKNLGPQLIILIVTVAIVVGGAYLNKVRILKMEAVKEAATQQQPNETTVMTTDKTLATNGVSEDKPIKTNQVIEKISIVPFQSSSISNSSHSKPSYRHYNRLEDGGDDEIIELEETKK